MDLGWGLRLRISETLKAQLSGDADAVDGDRSTTLQVARS